VDVLGAPPPHLLVEQAAADLQLLCRLLDGEQHGLRVGALAHGAHSAAPARDVQTLEMVVVCIDSALRCGSATRRDGATRERCARTAAELAQDDAMSGDRFHT
jgi:hypothetical protein